MEEKLLVMDCIKFLNNMIGFENEGILKISNIELRNFIKTIRNSDEASQEEIRNLGISKGYLEKNNEIDSERLEKLKQNILR